ncbi:MAG TPA: glutaredoxin family protein [Actinomycetota bacterium]|nr:glutaredoxin family protein [Actinomycetota bacterium]
MPPLVRMYSRPRCGLCDEARAVILEVRERVPFAFEEVSVEGDDALERAYGLRVPVVLVDGEERFELTVRADELVATLRAAGL